MNLDNVYVCDIEAKGLLPKVNTKDDIHVMSIGYFRDGEWQVMSTNNPEVIQRLVGNPDNVIVGHYFFNYDKPALEKAGYDFKAKVICSLALSYYLFSDRGSHGLEDWGVTFGIPKPVVDESEWEGIGAEKELFIKQFEAGQKSSQDMQLYVEYKAEKEEHYQKMKHRCEEDVKININMWLTSLSLLRELYDTDEEAIKAIGLTNFLMQVLRTQEENPIKLDVELTEKNRDILQGIVNEKEEELREVMPKVPKKVKRKKPKNMYKKDLIHPGDKMYRKNGDLTRSGEDWFDALEENGLPLDHTEPIKRLSASGEKWDKLLSRIDDPNVDKDTIEEITEIVGYDEPNPGAPGQVKDWLMTLGWKPRIFNEGANGPVPQLRDDDKNLCGSVTELAEIEPKVKILEGHSVAKHRLGVIKGFLKHVDEDGYVRAGANGFTRTFRMAHKAPIVNLPGNTSTHGELIRICLVAPEGYQWVNADLDSLEDKCKMIQVKPWATEEYLTKPDDYDPHIEISVMSGLMSEEDGELFKWYKSKPSEPELLEGWESSCPTEWGMNATKQELSDKITELSKTRHKGKTANYSCLPQDNTEVLTMEGWKYFDNLNEGDEVLTYNTETKEIEQDIILATHSYENAEVVNMSNHDWSIESTSDHRWAGIWRRRLKGVDGVVTTQHDHTFKTTDQVNSEFNIINSAPYKNSSESMSVDEAEFLGWLLSDGYLGWSKAGSVTSSSFGKRKFVKASIAQSSKKYFKEVKALLDRMGADYSIGKNNSDVEVFTLSSPWVRGLWLGMGLPKLDKHDICWSEVILGMGHAQREAFFHAFFLADGYQRSHANNTKIISQNKGNIADAVELCGYLLGNRVSRTNEHNKCIAIRFNSRGTTTGQRIKKEVSRSTDVFCLTTGNSTFIIRQNGKMTITGNCVYGVGAAKLSKTIGASQREAKKLIDTYWKIHYPVKEYTNTLITKEVNNRTWVYNPFTHLWLEIKGEHNKFSAVTQNFGAVVHARVMYFLIKNGINPIMNIHDEESWYARIGDEDQHKQIMAKCMDLVNQSFNLDVKFTSTPEFANSYGEVH